MLRACCHLVSQFIKTVKFLSLGFPADWAYLGDFPSYLLTGAIPIGSWEDSRSCNLREMAPCIKQVLQSLEMVSLELIDFVWELSMLELPRYISLPTLKHHKSTKHGTDDILREISERVTECKRQPEVEVLRAGS